MINTSPHNPNTLKVLLLEDHTSLAEEMIAFLASKDIRLTHCTNLAQLNQQLTTETYPLLILDRLLPEGDSLNHLDAIRTQHSGKIIVLSALGMSNDRILGLNSGADYYLAKPVDLNELIAVIYALTRTHDAKTSSNFNWLLSEETKSVITPTGTEITLTGSEFNLLKALMQQPNSVLKREEIVSLLGFDLARYDVRRLDTLVCRLRGKIRTTSGDNIPIHTFSKVGYAWKRNDSEQTDRF